MEKNIRLRPTRKQLKAAVLEALETRFELEAACRLAGVSRRAVFNWRLADPAFEKAIQEARKPAIERLKVATYDRALNGYDPVTGTQGEKLVDDRTASLNSMFVIKAHDERYRDSHRPHVDVGEMVITFNIPTPPGFLPRQQQPALPGEVIEGEITEGEKSAADASR